MPIFEQHILDYRVVGYNAHNYMPPRGWDRSKLNVYSGKE